MANEDTDRGPEGKPPRWNVVSLAAPFAGFLCGFAVGTAGQGMLWHGHPSEGLLWGPLVWAASCAFGLLAGGISLLRKERPWGLTLLGLILNALPFLAVLAWLLLGRWLF